jgi:glycosyltransferase involved in cell wall biosynthesis
MQDLLTVVIPTLNEESNILTPITSVKKLQANCFIVDSGSTDNTLKIARDNQCHCTVGSWKTFGHKLNWAFSNNPFKTPWVMRLDADEYLTDELIDEIKATLPLLDDNVTAIAIKRRTVFLNRWIRHGGWYPMWDIRLLRPEYVAYDAVQLTDEYPIVKTGKVINFKNDFVDVKNQGCLHWSLKQLYVANRERWLYSLQLERYSKCNKAQYTHYKTKKVLLKKIYDRLPLFIRPLLYWSYRYFFQLGFLDGIPGLIFHFLHAFWYRFLIDAMIYEVDKCNITLEKLEQEFQRYIC